MDNKVSDNEFAIEFHKKLDLKQRKASSNNSWPLSLIEYYNEKEKKNEVEKNRLI